MRQDALEPTHRWRALLFLTALFLAVSLMAAPAADAARPFLSGGVVTFNADCDVSTSAIQIPSNGKRIFEVKANLSGPGFFNAMGLPTTGKAMNGATADLDIASGTSGSRVSNGVEASFNVQLLDRKGKGVYFGTATTPIAEGKGCTVGSVAIVWNRA